MGWHSDGEKELGNESIIASLRLGAIRKFAFKHTNEKCEFMP
ncbi:alpha-ketoglutarate-dependent dioxygenase AlkB [Neisseria yangbaofengii]|nr:alpha-ketoglutarate-dependent dioxygenase AlkB [Neisseria yangbaofengii]